jgi:hypothetical protein
VKVASAEIHEKDYLVDKITQAGGDLEPGSQKQSVTKGSSGEVAGAGVIWRFFGLPDTTPVTGITPRLVYVAARGRETAAALTFVLDKPRAVRGLLLFDPLIEALPPEIVSRLHAVRCPGIIVVSNKGDVSRLSSLAYEPLGDPFSRMPNMSCRVVEPAECVDVRSWQRLVEQMPHRYSMKSRHRETK